MPWDTEPSRFSFQALVLFRCQFFKIPWPANLGGVDRPEIMGPILLALLQRRLLRLLFWAALLGAVCDQLGLL